MSNEINILKSIINDTNAIFFVKDEQGRFLMINRAFEKVFKKTEKEILGKSDADFTPKDLANEYRANDLKVRELGKPITFIETVQTTEGTKKFVSHKFPVNNIENSPNATGGIAIEITDIKL